MCDLAEAADVVRSNRVQLLVEKISNNFVTAQMVLEVLEQVAALDPMKHYDAPIGTARGILEVLSHFVIRESYGGVNVREPTIGNRYAILRTDGSRSKETYRYTGGGEFDHNRVLKRANIIELIEVGP